MAIQVLFNIKRIDIQYNDNINKIKMITSIRSKKLHKFCYTVHVCIDLYMAAWKI